MIKVLIVEDSKVISAYLKRILSSDPEIEVIGTVFNGKEAIEFLKNNSPDVITMDIDMPIMNGLEATREIMAIKATPIIIVTSSRNSKEIKYSMQALASGALSLLEKPYGVGHDKEEESKKKITKMIKIYSSVKVITRKRPDAISHHEKERVHSSVKGNFKNCQIVAIGASSGGPQVLSTIFSKISSNFPYPILVVQHIAKGFLRGMVDWLNSSMKINAKIGISGEKLKEGTIYFAPDDYNMGVKNNRIVLFKCISNSSCLCPSVAYLFESLATEMPEKTLAILLTGMGTDGSKELKKLNNNGAVTIAQDKASSIVHGMPGEAIRLGGADFIYSANEISRLLYTIEIKQLNSDNKLKGQKND